MIKKLLIFSLVLVGMVTLSACKTDDGPTDLEKLQEAMDDLTIAAEVSDDIVFVDSGLHDVVITWESSNTDVIADNGTVTRPLFSEGDISVTVTASLTIGEDTLTKIFIVTVLAIADISDAEQVADALGSLLLTAADLVVSDIILPAEIVKDEFTASVTWESSNTDVITDAGVVTRPAVGEGNVVVTMTATITVGAVSDTKEFLVTVKEDDPSNLFTSVAALHAASLLDDVVEFQGIVTGIFATGYFLSDGVNAIGVYNPATTLTLAIGDEVYVKGEYAVYNTLYQINYVSEEEVISTGNANPLTAVAKTVAEMLALDSSDLLIHGMYYEVTGTLEIIGDFGNIYLVDGDDELLIYYDSLEASILALEAEVGKEVTIVVFYYTDHGTNGPMVAFDGGADDIMVSTITDAEALAADISAAGVDVPNATVGTIVLPTVGPNGSTYTNWVSSDDAVFANDGTFVARGTSTVVITFTADIAKGSEVGVATFEVVVPVLSTVAEALALSVSDYVEVSGIIYDVSYYGFFIEEDGSYIFIYDNSFLDSITIGDEITIIGTRGLYSGLAQVNVIGYEMGTTGNAVPTATVLSVGDLANGLVEKGTVATVTGTYAIVVGSDGYDDYVITDSAGSVFEIYYRSNVDELTTFLDTVITLNITYYNNSSGLFSGVAANVTTGVTVTDAMMAADAAAWINLGNIDNVDSNIILPVANDNGAVITWETDDAAHVTDEGVVNQVLGSDTVVTLTATVTVGTEVSTRVIEVTVLDSTGAVPLSIAEALLEEDYENLLVQGIITNVFGSSVLVLQDADGVAAITTYDYGFFADEGLALGDEIIVRATRETYYGLNELTNMTLVEVVSTGNAMPVITVTVADLVIDMVGGTYAYQGQNFVLTGLTIVDMDYDNKAGYIVVEDDQDPANQIIFSTYDIPYAQDLWIVGEVIDLSVIGWDFYYELTRVKVYVYPTLTDAEVIFMSELELSLPSSAISDMVLPLLEEEFGATITWSSDTPAVITDAGVVVRPAIGEDDAIVTLTATITSGSETVDKVFVVTVAAEVPVASQDLFFSEYGEPDGGTCKYLEIYNPTGASVDLSNYKIINAYNGNAWDYTNVLSYGYILTLVGTLNAGETYVIYNGDCVDIDGESQDVSISSTLFPTSLASGLENSSSALGFNGDDTIGLFNGDVLIDVIGQYEVDPGSNWPVGNGDLLGGTTANVIMVRVPTVTTGELDWSVGAMQWIVSTDDRDYSTVGVHTYTPAP